MPDRTGRVKHEYVKSRDVTPVDMGIAIASRSCDVVDVAPDEERFYAVLGDRLRSARKRSGSTQEALAKKVGISRTSLTNIERGRQAVAVHLLDRFASALQIVPGDLLPCRGAPSAKALAAQVPESQRAWVVGILEGED